jgi:hypothetical protein
MAKKSKSSSARIASKISDDILRKLSGDPTGSYQSSEELHASAARHQTPHGEVRSGLEPMNWTGQIGSAMVTRPPTSTIKVREPHRQIAENIHSKILEIIQKEPKSEPKKETPIDRLMEKFYNIANKQEK